MTDGSPEGSVVLGACVANSDVTEVLPLSPQLYSFCGNVVRPSVSEAGLCVWCRAVRLRLRRGVIQVNVSGLRVRTPDV